MPDFRYRYALQEIGDTITGTAGGAPSPGYSAWFDAEASIFTDAAGTVPATVDGDAILNWQSKGGSYGALVCKVPATFAAPHLKLAANGINGKPVVKSVAASLEVLSDAAETLTIFETGILLAAQGTVFAVFRKAAGLGGVWSDSSTPAMIAARVVAGPAARCSLNDGTVKTADKTMSFGVVLHTFHHAASVLYSGVNDTRTASLASAAAGSVGAGAGYLRLFIVTSANLDGDIAELIFYATAQTENERMVTERYLAIKYGITLPY